MSGLTDRWIALASSALDLARHVQPAVTDVQALATELRRATTLALAEREYRLAIVQFAYERQNITIETIPSFRDAQERLNRARAKLGEAGGEP